MSGGLKISQMPDAGTGQATDQLPIARSGSNFSLLLSKLRDYIFGSDAKLNGDLVLPKDSGVGIQVDITNPTFGWRDIIGDIRPRATGGPAPVFTAFIGGSILEYAYAVNDVVDKMTFHLPHDYVMGSDLYFHVHCF